MMKLRKGNYARTLAQVSADLILTSPPYNIGSQCPAKVGKRSKKNGTYDPKSWGGIEGYADTLPETVYMDTQVTFLRWCARHLNPQGIVAYNHKPVRVRGQSRLRHPMEWITQVDDLTLMEEVIWDRGSTHNHSLGLMWPQTERIYVLRLTDSQYRIDNSRGNLEFRSDVWRIPPERSDNTHNAPFPLALAENAIKAWCPKGGLVVDPYMGSGTTALAARNTGRRFEGSEILDKYHQLATRRLAA